MKVEITKQQDFFVLTLSTDAGVVTHEIKVSKDDLIKIRNTITLFIGFETERIKKEGLSQQKPHSKG